jgi:hypothetical protein
MKKIVPQFAMKKSIDNLRSSFQKIIRKDGKISNADVVDAVQYVENNSQKKGRVLSSSKVQVLKNKSILVHTSAGTHTGEGKFRK